MSERRLEAACPDPADVPVWWMPSSTAEVYRPSWRIPAELAKAISAPVVSQ